jgi:hypothetical protein
VRHRLLVPLVGAALIAAPAVAYATTPPPPPPVDPPSVAQLCAATGIGTIDAYLAAVTESQLIGDLAPLLDLTVPRTGAAGVEVEADVTLEQLRDVLECDAPDPTPTTTPTPTPTTTPAPTEEPEPTRTRTPAPDNDDDDDDCRRCTQVDITPRGGVDTGDGSTAHIS